MEVPVHLLAEIANAGIYDGQDIAVSPLSPADDTRFLSMKFLHIVATMCRMLSILQDRLDGLNPTAATLVKNTSTRLDKDSDILLESLTGTELNVPAFKSVSTRLRSVCISYVTKILKYAAPSVASGSQDAYLSPFMRSKSSFSLALWQKLARSFAACDASGSRPAQQSTESIDHLMPIAHPIVLDFARMHFELADSEPVGFRFSDSVERGISIAAILMYLDYVLPASASLDGLTTTRLSNIEVEFFCGRFSHFGIAYNRLIETAKPQYTAIDAWNERQRCIDCSSNFPYVEADIFACLQTPRGVKSLAELSSISVMPWSPTSVWIRNMLSIESGADKAFACSRIAKNVSIHEHKIQFIQECERQLKEAKAQIAASRKSLLISVKPKKTVTFEPTRVEIDAMDVVMDDEDVDGDLAPHSRNAPRAGHAEGGDEDDDLDAYSLLSDEDRAALATKVARQNAGRRGSEEDEDDDDDDQGGHSDNDCASIADEMDYIEENDQDASFTDGADDENGAMVDATDTTPLALLASHIDKCKTFIMQFLNIVDNPSFENGFAKANARGAQVPTQIWGSDKTPVALYVKVDQLAARLNATCVLVGLYKIAGMIASDRREARPYTDDWVKKRWIKFAHTPVDQQKERTWQELYEFAPGRRVPLAYKWARRVEALVLGLESITARLVCDIIATEKPDDVEMDEATDQELWNAVRDLRLDAELKVLFDRAQMALARFALMLYRTRSITRNRFMSQKK